MPAERNLLMVIVNNFIKSLTPKRRTGRLMGSDYLGTKYFEEAADPARGRRQARRWFVPEDGQFDKELPAEWEAWLRKRRAQPPTDDEVARNKAIMDMKKINAAKLAEERGEAIEKPKPQSAFPVWEEYEVEPGQKHPKYKVK